MDLENILAKINTFKETHPTAKFSLRVEGVKDLDDLYGDLYLLAHEASPEEDAIDDELLISIEKPSQADLDQLKEIAMALEKFL